jgi:hypothetical protein
MPSSELVGVAGGETINQLVPDRPGAGAIRCGAFAGGAPRRASANFQHGLVPRVSDRLDALHCARDATVREQRSIGTDLIVAKNRVIEEAFGEIAIRLVRMAATGDHTRYP